MPLIEVKLYDRRLQNPDTTDRIIREMTDALARACDDEAVKQHTTVIVTGIPPQQWGVAGNPGS
jgi:phenylpyruvate tautomerase PptA (4-oxalocrotonate tautomerase family)